MYIFLVEVGRNGSDLVRICIQQEQNVLDVAFSGCAITKLGPHQVEMIQDIQLAGPILQSDVDGPSVLAQLQRCSVGTY